MTYYTKQILVVLLSVMLVICYCDGKSLKPTPISESKYSDKYDESKMVPVPVKEQRHKKHSHTNRHNKLKSLYQKLLANRKKKLNSASSKKINNHHTRKTLSRRKRVAENELLHILRRLQQQKFFNDLENDILNRMIGNSH